MIIIEVNKFNFQIDTCLPVCTSPLYWTYISHSGWPNVSTRLRPDGLQYVSPNVVFNLPKQFGQNRSNSTYVNCVCVPLFVGDITFTPSVWNYTCVCHIFHLSQTCCTALIFLGTHPTQPRSADNLWWFIIPRWIALLVPHLILCCFWYPPTYCCSDAHPSRGNLISSG